MTGRVRVKVMIPVLVPSTVNAVCVDVNANGEVCISFKVVDLEE